HAGALQRLDGRASVGWRLATTDEHERLCPNSGQPPRDDEAQTATATCNHVCRIVPNARGCGERWSDSDALPIHADDDLADVAAARHMVQRVANLARGKNLRRDRRQAQILEQLHGLTEQSPADVRPLLGHAVEVGEKERTAVCQGSERQLTALE